MKNWQFYMLMATIWAAPLPTGGYTNVVAIGVFLALSAIEIVRGR